MSDELLAKAAAALDRYLPHQIAREAARQVIREIRVPDPAMMEAAALAIVGNNGVRSTRMAVEIAWPAMIDRLTGDSL